MGECENFFMSMIQASEMLCSLRFEDMRGCPYHSFTPRSIAMLSLTSTLMAAAALLVGM